MLLAKIFLMDRVIWGLFVGGVLVLGAVAAIGAVRYERARHRLARQSLAHSREYLNRSEERAVASIKRSEEHYDRVEKLLGEISEKLDHLGGG